MTKNSADLDASMIDAVLEFWLGFDAADAASFARCSRQWFSSEPALDREIGARFGKLLARAADGELESWTTTARGRLALIVVLDQFTRNVHRGSAAAFAHDAAALRLTLDGIDSGAERELSAIERVFFFMPLQHAESIDVQDLAVRTFEELAVGDEPDHVQRTLDSFAGYARLHRDIISRFGRFPHRNELLGRPPTAAEREFLAAGGPSFGQRPRPGTG